MWPFSCFKSINGHHPPDTLRSRNTFEQNPEYPEVSRRLHSFEAFGTFALAFPESSDGPWQIVVPSWP